MKDTYVKRYNDAAHAMQSGVKMEISLRGEAGAAADPKHLRVGVNSALVDSSALANLLIKRGLITEEEYFRCIAEGMENEKHRYEQELFDATGTTIKLV